MRVLTMHSAYEIDEVAGTLTRHPTDADASDLRQDGQTVRLLEIITLEVGVMAEFLCSGVSDDPGVQTYRRTTPVREIIQSTEASP